MINRTFIRTKVLQILYAHYQKGSKDLKVVENELNFSLQKTYQLYHYLLLVVIKLTDTERKRLDRLNHKHLLTKEKKYLNEKFTDNQMIKRLRNHPALIQFTNKHANWLQNNNESNFIRSLLNEIKQSDSYKKYIFPDDIYNNNYEFWKTIFEQIILKSQIVSEWLEQKSIYWNDDLETITVFVLKTLERFQNKSSPMLALLPMVNSTVQEYAVQLLRFSIIEAKKNSNLINVQMKNWDKERIALLDLIIMQMALAEINNFPTIPLKVTLNEYIDLARYYSTPKSTSFVNGILQAVVSSLKTNKN